MRRLIFALLLLAGVISGCFWGSHTVARTTGAIADALNNGQIDEAYRLWCNTQNLLGALLQHEELDEADRLFTRLLTARADGQTDESALEQASLLAQLRHLPDTQYPSLKNLF